MERTLVIVKPDGVQRGLVGEIVQRFEKRGFRIVALKMLQVSRSLAEQHYAVHKGKFFYEDLVTYISSSPVVAMVIEGHEAIKTVRAMVGSTRPYEAAPGTIRGDLALMGLRNLIHASDSPETSASEIALWFAPDQVLDYRRDIDNGCMRARQDRFPLRETGAGMSNRGYWMRRIGNRRLPQLLKVVVGALFGREDVDNHITVVQEHPS